MINKETLGQEGIYKFNNGLLTEYQQGDCIEKYEYNEKGNRIHDICSIYDEDINVDYLNEEDGLYYYDRWYEYDKNNNLIHYKDNDDRIESRCEKEYCYEENYKYDSHDRVIQYTDSIGCRSDYKYDEKGNMIYYKSTSTRYGKTIILEEIEWEYDEKGNLIYYKDDNSEEFEEINNYDEKGNHIYFKRQMTRCNEVIIFQEIEWEYDEKGNITHYKDNTGVEEWNEYDNNGNHVYYEDSNGVKWGKEFDYDVLIRFTEYNKGNIIHSIIDGVEEWFEYDERGNRIYYRNRNENIEESYTYDSNNKRIHSKQIQY